MSDARCPAAQTSPLRDRIDLNGCWTFQPSVGNAAFQEVRQAASLILVPGAWQAQGFGEPGGTIPSANIGPGESSADHLRHNLMDRCLYKRDVRVPEEWRGRRVFLVVRRAYRYADVELNGRRMGQHEGFCSPFELDITEAVQFGENNSLVIGIDNRPRPGKNALGTANLMGNWGGIGGNVYVECRSAAYLSDVFAVPDIHSGTVRLRVTVRSADGAPRKGLRLQASVCPWLGMAGSTGTGGAAQCPAVADSGPDGTSCTELPVTIPDVRLWSPEHPNLYVAQVTLSDDNGPLDSTSVRFGMREIRVQGKDIHLNGKPIYLAGYGDDSTEPLTGMLPADKNLYRKRLAFMRELGFNFVRHHSCVPHDEYLEAADEVGILVQPEMGLAYTTFWYTGYQLFQQEWPQTIQALRNHPCVWSWCMGNELFLNDVPEALDEQARAKGATLTRGEVLEIVQKAYRQAKELDPTRPVHASDGGTVHEFTDVISSPSAARQGPMPEKPYLLHEYGNYHCSLPDLSLIPRLSGVMRPATYERAAAFVAERHMEGVYPRLLRSSLLMLAEAQKYHMEKARLDDRNTGYSYWLGVDFPDSPEGCWDEGILNQLWEPKPYLTEAISDSNGPSVLLIGLDAPQRTLFADETRTVPILLSHFGGEAVASGDLHWRVLCGNRIVSAGEFGGVSCPAGKTLELGKVAVCGESALAAPGVLRLEVELRAGAERVCKNSWDFFVYPRSAATPALPGVYTEVGPLPGARVLGGSETVPNDVRLLITRQLSAARHAELISKGHAAVLMVGTGGLKDVKADSDSLRRNFFLNQFGGGFGGVVEDHPVFDGIPHDGRIRPCLWGLVTGGSAVAADELPAGLRDGLAVWGLRLSGWISRVKELQRLALVTETMTEKGLHLVLCGLDVTAEAPECRYVLSRLVDYFLSGKPFPGAGTSRTEDLQTMMR